MLACLHTSVHVLGKLEVDDAGTTCFVMSCMRNGRAGGLIPGWYLDTIAPVSGLCTSCPQLHQRLDNASRAILYTSAETC